MTWQKTLYNDGMMGMSLSTKLLLLAITALIILPRSVSAESTFFPVQSIDTMKYSRDKAREKNNIGSFDAEIEKQMKEIASLGATHVAIGTPYDEEFIPFLTRWVDMARRYNLQVWFRGNFAGWENWFNYPDMSRQEHITKTVSFIQDHPQLFKDGDIFTPCHECENGGPGDPRNTHDVDGYREFIINEYQAVDQAFKKQKKQVTSNYVSMNADIARLIMDRATTAQLGGVVCIDHYVKDIKTLVQDIKEIADLSGGKIILGELGVPVPDIHGEMTPQEQAAWLDEAMQGIISTGKVIGINYWVNYGGSTRLYDNDGLPRPAVQIVARYFKPYSMTGSLKDTLGFPINKVTIQTKYAQMQSGNGTYTVPILDDDQIRFTKDGYIAVTLHIDPRVSPPSHRDIVLEKPKKTLWEQLLERFQSLFKY